MKILATILAFSISSTCFAFWPFSTTVQNISDASTLKDKQIELAKEDFNKVVWAFLSDNHNVFNVDQLLRAISKTRSPFENEEKELLVKALMERLETLDNKDLQYMVKVNFDINQVSSFSEEKSKKNTRNGFLLEVSIKSPTSGCHPIYYTTYILLEKTKLESASKNRGVIEKIKQFTFPCFGSRSRSGRNFLGVIQNDFHSFIS